MAMTALTPQLLKHHRFRAPFAALLILSSIMLLLWTVQTPSSLSEILNHNGKVRAGKVSPTPADNNEDVAFCMAIKDQYRDLPEFLVRHYRHHGIRRFYIMDDQSIYLFPTSKTMESQDLLSHSSITMPDHSPSATRDAGAHL